MFFLHISRQEPLFVAAFACFCFRGRAADGGWLAAATASHLQTSTSGLCLSRRLLAVYSSREQHLHRPCLAEASPAPPHACPPVSPRKSEHCSTWLILNGSRTERCLFINTEPLPPVYCNHGNNHLLNKQPARAVAPRSSLRSQEQSQLPAATLLWRKCSGGRALPR